MRATISSATITPARQVAQQIEYSGILGFNLPRGITKLTAGLAFDKFAEIDLYGGQGGVDFAASLEARVIEPGVLLGLHNRVGDYAIPA